jgi:hypothetical protein
MSEERLAVLGVAFALVGLGLLFFPRFMMHLRGRWSLGVAKWIVETFPEKAQTIVGRMMGVSFIILGAWILSNHGAVGFGLKEDPETLSEWKQDVYDDKDYHEQAVVEGPAYTQSVIDQIRVTHRWHYYESPEPFIVVVSHPETYFKAEIGFLEAMKKGVSARQIGTEIAEALDKAFADDRADLTRAGTIQQELAQRQQFYGPRILKKANDDYQSAAASQSMKMAEMSLKKASDFWLLDDKASAVQFAREARDGFARLLGPYHPKVKELDRMIQTAGGQ